jgi:hypothetical protein
MVIGSHDNTAITHTPGGTVLTGDAIEFFRVAHLKGFLKLYAKTGMIPTRGVTITHMLALASDVTKKKYRRGDAMKAHDDLKVWCDAFRATIPDVEG